MAASARSAVVTGAPSVDPIARFRRWLDDAFDSDAVRYPHAACLSTVDHDGTPDGRMVLVHFVDPGGAFVFSTDTRSVKVTQLNHRPVAALTFDWSALDRQVRVRGRVEAGDDVASDRCFEERPHGSRITAWASRQSRPSDSDDALATRHAEAAARFEGRDPVPRPETWRAYLLVPHTIELWRAGRHRLHRRHRYTWRGEGGRWHVVRLEP